MKLRLEKITSTHSGLVMGVQIHGPKDSWIRFGLLEVPWSCVDENLLDAFYVWRQCEDRELVEDTPLAFDWA